MTAIRSARPRDDREVVRDVDHRGSGVVPQPLELGEIRDWVTTSRPVVGSSRTTTRRAVDECDRDGDPLLLPTG